MRRRLLASTLVAAALTAAPSIAQAQTVLVVPFELERFDARVGWLSEGVAVGLSAMLQARGVTVVTRDERLAALDRLQLPPAATLTRATLLKVAELVGAARIVLGRVAERDGAVTITGRVIDVESAALTELPPEAAPVSALFAAFERVAARLGGHAPEGASGAVAPTVPSFELYVRGLVAATAETQERLLGQALALAPAYDAAREALWDVQSTRGVHAQALATAGGVGGAAVPGGNRPEWRVRAASSLVHLGRYDEAFALLSALSAVSREPAVATLQGVVQLRRGSTPQSGRATYYFNQAVERDAADPDACFNLGYAYWLDKDALAAAYWLREAVRRSPSDGDAHFVLAAALAASGASPEADRERELARRLSERWEAASAEAVPRGLERLPDRTRRVPVPLAEALSAGAQRDQRDLAAFHVEAARRAFEGGRDQETIREVQRALYLTPYDADALRLLGRAQTRSGLLQEAAHAFKIAIWSAESAGAQVELGEVLLRLHDRAGALRAAERALVLEPGHPGAVALAARARTGPGVA